MNASKIVVHEIQRQGMPVILDLFAVCIGQSRKSSHIHPYL